jgi:hypothetical protein
MRVHKPGANAKPRPSAGDVVALGNSAQHRLERVPPEGGEVKMNGQSRSFVKQVQVDLVALGDVDLFNVVQQWIDGSHSSEGAFDVPEETRLALGYIPALSDARLPAHRHAGAPGEDRDWPAQWHAPTPQQLRALLTAMDVSAFARHVITFAYQWLHPTHPEWYDGVTFNAHLANYLRRMRDETASRGQRAMQR